MHAAPQPHRFTVRIGYCNFGLMNSPDRTGIRINLTLPPDIVATLDRMGAVTGAGRASIIREWLIEGRHTFVQMADALELAAQKNLDAFNVMTKAINGIAREADQLTLDMKRTSRAMRRKSKP